MKTKQRSIFWIWMAAVLATLQACGQAETDDAVTAKQAAFSATGEVLSFETLSGWTTNKGNISLNPYAVHGNHSLAVSYGGDATLTSIPIGPVGPVDTHVTLDLLQPSTHPNPWWRGTVKIALVSPSLGMYWQELPEVSLQGHPLGQFVRLSFPIPVGVRTQLNSQNPTDLTIKVLLNVPMVAGPWLVDRLSFGTVEEPEPPADDDPPSDDDPPADDEPATDDGSTTDDDSSTDDLPDASIDDPPTDDDPADDDPVTDDPGTDDPPPDDGTVPGTSYEFFIKWPANVDLETILLGSYGGDLRIGDSARIIGAGGPDSRANVTAVDGGGLSRLGVGGQVAGIWSDSPQHGPTQIATGAHVFGNITTSAGTVDVQSGALLDGVIYDNQPLGPLATEQWSVFFPDSHAGAVNVSSSNSPVELPPGAYGELNISSGGVLVLSRGQYTFETIGSWNGSAITLDNAAGPIQVYARNALTLQGPITRTAPEANVLVGFAGHGYAWLQNDANLNFALVAPWGTVTIHPPDGNNTGSVFAKSINADATQDYVLQPFSGELLCGADSECSALCPCGIGEPCDGDAECIYGECHDTENVCVCEPDCDGKACGDDPADGCGGICPAVCEDGEPDCVDDVQCKAGSVCAVGAGPQKGHPAGTNVCLKAICLEMDPGQPNCGVGDADCGPCIPYEPDCAGRTCGSDGWGGSCGETGEDQYCTEKGVLGVSYSSQRDADHSENFPDPRPVVAVDTPIVGRLPGTFSVSDRGTANYRIPIEVAPGRGSLQPRLAFSYLGTKDNGLMGIGWRLDGLSSIARCPRIQAHAGQAEPILLGEQDDYCLDGQRLVRIDITDLPPGIEDDVVAELRTEVESFSRVFMLGDPAAPSSFHVYRRDGTIQVYGEIEGEDRSLNSLVLTRTTPRVWGLSQVQDRAGNLLQVEYQLRNNFAGLLWNEELATSYELKPFAIYYGGHAGGEGGSALPHDRRVVLDYEPRQDRRKHYVLGEETSSNERLARVRIEADGKPLRTYELNYTDDGPLLLESVQLCASDGSSLCLPRTKFEYDQQFGFEPEVVVDLEGWSAFRTPKFTLDMNGDGATEFIRVVGTELGVLHARLISRGTSPQFEPDFAVHPQELWLVPVAFVTEGIDVDSAHVADLNGDGLDDVIALYEDRTVKLFTSTGTAFDISDLDFGTFLDEFGNPQRRSIGRRAIIGDYNADSRPDILNPNGGIFFHDGDGFELSRFYYGSNKNIMVIDLDGDGDQDILREYPDYGWTTPGFLRPAQIQGEYGEWVEFSPWPTGGGKQIDVNGDGLTDLLKIGKDNIQAWINTGSTGAGDRFELVNCALDVPPALIDAVTQDSPILDYNGDGRDDIIVPTLGAVLMAGVDYQFEALEGAFDPFDPLDTKEDLLVADVDGDGARDLVRFDLPGASFAYRLSKAARTARLIRVTDGFGKAINVEYDTVQLDAAGQPTKTYTLGSDVASPGGRPLANVAPLVSAHTESQDGGEIHRYVYRYQDAVIGEGGRGWFGFKKRWITEVDVASDSWLSETELQFHNGPFVHRAGLVEKATTKRRIDHARWRRTVTTNSWSRELVQGSSVRRYPWLRRQTHQVFDETVEGGAEINYVYTSRLADSLGNLVRSASYMCQNSGCVDTQSPEVISIDLDSAELISVDTMANTPADIDGFWLKFSPGEVVTTSQVAPDIHAAQSRETHFEYEDNGLLRAVTREPSSKSAAPPAKSLYQRAEYIRSAPLWNLEALRVVDADDNERRTELDYDYRGLFPVRQRTTVDGVVLETEVELSDATGRPLTVMDPNGVVVQYGYDVFGREREVVSSTGTARTRYLAPGEGDCPYQAIDGLGVMCEVVASYDPGDPSLVVYDADNGYAVRLFDAFGRVMMEKTHGVGAEVQQEFTYDERGRLQMASLPHVVGLADDQGAMVYEYDDLDRVISETTPDGRVALYDYKTRFSATSSERNFFFDGSRPYDMVVMDKPDGLADSREVVVRDPWGMPTSTMQGSLDGSNPGPLNSYQYGFFRQLERIDGEDDFLDPEYDLIGRVTSLDSRANGTRTMEYSGFDQVVIERHAGATPDAFFHEYDAAGRMRARHRCSDATCSGLDEQVASWTYDSRPSCDPGDTACENGEERLLGKLVQTMGRPDDNGVGLDARTVTSYYYETDPALPGRLTSMRQQLPDVAEPLITGFRYDHARLDGVDYPASDGEPFGTDYEYDPHGTLRAVREAAGTTIWRIQEAEHGVRIKRESFGNDLETTYDYYSTTNTIGGCGGGGKSCMPGLLRSITTGEGASADKTSYEYNALGLMDTRVQEFGSTSITDTYTYHYERLDVNEHIRDTSSGVSNTTRDYDYSPGGNLLRVETTIDGSTSVDTYHYGGDFRVREFNSRPIAYNSNGNILTRQTTDGTEMAYRYNDLDLPWRISRDGQLTYLHYDADGTRVAKRGPTQSTLYVGSLYECEDSTGPDLGDPVVCTEHRYKVYAGSRLVAQVTRTPGDEERTYIHADHLGSVTLLSDDSGISGRRSFDPFGQPENDLASTSIHAGFTGHEHDQELGLINMRGRLYDPELRRFTTPDPFVAEPLHPQGLNRYAYVMNNPLLYTDPSGFQGVDPGAPDRSQLSAGQGSSGSPSGQTGPSAHEIAVLQDMASSGSFTDATPAQVLSVMMISVAIDLMFGHSSLHGWAQGVVASLDARQAASAAGAAANPSSGGHAAPYGPSGDTMPIGGPQAMNVGNPGGSATMSAASAVPQGGSGSGGAFQAGAQGSRGYSVPLEWWENDAVLRDAQDGFLAMSVVALSIASGAIVVEGAAALAVEVRTTMYLMSRLGPVSGVGLGGGAVAGGVKAINLPAFTKVTVDMAHIAERHMTGGAFTAGRTIFTGMSERGVMAAIRQAYQSSSTVSVQGERLLLRGATRTGVTVEMWFNKATKVIETAYPVVGR